MLQNKDFLKVDKYLEDEYPVTCIISDRGLGKTHSAIEAVAKSANDNGTKFVMCRLTYEMFKNTKDDWANRHGFKCNLSSHNITKDNKVVGYLASLNTYANSKGGNYNDVEWMIFDEFNEDNTIENAFAKFLMLLDSYKRHRKNFKCVLLGNMINKNNWFLNAMGIRVDWKSEDDVIYCLPEYGVKIVIVGSKTFSKVNEARSDINKLASADAVSHAFYNEREFLNDDTDKVTNYVKWVKDTFKPIFFFYYGEFKYVFGRYQDKDYGVRFFVDINNIYFKEFENKVPEFSFDVIGNATSKKSKILDDEDIQGFQQKFFQIAKQEKLMYGSFDAFEELQRFIALGSMFD